MSKMSQKYQVCPRCKGEGTVANPAFDGMSTAEMYDDMGYEETREFLDEYLRRGGMYDVLCPLCGGRRVATADEVEAYEDREEMLAEMRAEERYGGL